MRASPRHCIDRYLTISVAPTFLGWLFFRGRNVLLRGTRTEECIISGTLVSLYVDWELAMAEILDGIVLRKACDLLSSELRWTSGAWARDYRGRRCSPLSSEARRWCAWGALQRCAYDLTGDAQVSRKIADRINKTLVPGPGGIAFVNERGGFELVKKVMIFWGATSQRAIHMAFPRLSIYPGIRRSRLVLSAARVAGGCPVPIGRPG